MKEGNKTSREGGDQKEKREGKKLQNNKVLVYFQQALVHRFKTVVLQQQMAYYEVILMTDSDGFSALKKPQRGVSRCTTMLESLIYENNVKWSCRYTKENISAPEASKIWVTRYNYGFLDLAVKELDTKSLPYCVEMKLERKQLTGNNVCALIWGKKKTQLRGVNDNMSKKKTEWFRRREHMLFALQRAGDTIKSQNKPN